MKTTKTRLSTARDKLFVWSNVTTNEEEGVRAEEGFFPELYSGQERQVNGGDFLIYFFRCCHSAAGLLERPLGRPQPLVAQANFIYRDSRDV